MNLNNCSSLSTPVTEDRKFEHRFVTFMPPDGANIALSYLISALYLGCFFFIFHVSLLSKKNSLALVSDPPPFHLIPPSHSKCFSTKIHLNKSVSMNFKLVHFYNSGSAAQFVEILFYCNS